VNYKDDIVVTMSLGEMLVSAKKEKKFSLHLGIDDVLPEERKRLGPSQLEDIALVRLNLLSQVRQRYDPEGIDELARSMIVPDGNGGHFIDVIQPPTIARLTYEQATQYVKKVNTVFNAQHTVEELTVSGIEAGKHEGKILIVIAGHRRTLAIYRAADMIGEDTRSLDVSSNVIDGDKLTFSEAISIQYRENFHRRPDSWEDAFAINAIYQEGVAKGEYVTFKDCADHLSIDPDRVARAYRFQTLPDIIKDMVVDQVMPFGRAILLTKLLPVLAYAKCKHKLGDKQNEDFLRRIKENKLYLPEITKYFDSQETVWFETEYLHFATKILDPKLRKKRDPGLMIDRTISALLDTNDNFTMQLDRESYHTGRAETAIRVDARKLATNALKIIASTILADMQRKQDGRSMVFSHSAVVNRDLKTVARYAEAMKLLKQGDEEQISLLTNETLAAIARLQDDAQRDRSLDDQPDLGIDSDSKEVYAQELAIF
jgi:hypothetical protein